MILIILCSFLYLFYIINDLIPVYKTERRNVFWVYLSLFVFSYVLFILIINEVKLPSPAKPLKEIVISIFG
jgi:hypothetical protein